MGPPLSYQSSRRIQYKTQISTCIHTCCCGCPYTNCAAHHKRTRNTQHTHTQTHTRTRGTRRSRSSRSGRSRYLQPWGTFVWEYLGRGSRLAIATAAGQYAGHMAAHQHQRLAMASANCPSKCHRNVLICAVCLPLRCFLEHRRTRINVRAPCLRKHYTSQQGRAQ